MFRSPSWTSICIVLKGSVSWDFRPPVFSWFEPIWAPDKRIRFRLRLDIRSQSNLRGVLHTANSISTVCCTPMRSSPKYVAHHGINLCGICNTPHRRSPQCVAHREVRAQNLEVENLVTNALSMPRQFFFDVTTALSYSHLFLKRESVNISTYKFERALYKYCN